MLYFFREIFCAELVAELDAALQIVLALVGAQSVAYAIDATLISLRMKGKTFSTLHCLQL